jgi:diguanylate cyclase (GGDEF)-like protein/PAS domain S-box-containing protein
MFGFGAATLLLMLSAGYILHVQQRDTLNRVGAQRATMLATTLSKSGVSWVLANDVVGMQEVMAGLSGTTDLKRVFVLTPEGEVLASTRPTDVGLFVSDAISQQLLKAAPSMQVLVDQTNLIDVAMPVMAGSHHIGWVRVELTRDSIKAELRRLDQIWLSFVLVAVLLIMFVTQLLSSVLTGGLEQLMRVTGEVIRGNREARANILRHDEVGMLAQDFNFMLDTLHESDLRFRQLAENINQVFWMTEPDKQKMLYVSSAYERIWGRSLQSLLDAPQSWLDAVHPDDRQRMAEAAPKQAQGLYDEEYRIIRSDGEIHWVHDRAFPIRDNQGVVYRIVGIAEDVTERKQADEVIRVSAAAFETHEAIMITDARANIIRVNQAFYDITGFSLEEVLGKNPRILSSGRQDKAFYTDMWHQLLNNGTWTGEIWDRRKSGQIYPKWMTITAVKDNMGKTTEYVAIFSDITLRKQSEEEIRNLAFYDALTRLPNRRLLMDRLRSALALSARSNKYGAVLFLDMDRFKTINDSLGHDVGDQLLIEVAERIQSCVREVDSVARLGGDEFVVLIEEVDENAEEATQKIALITEKIRESLCLPYQLDGNEHHSSPSIGVSMYCCNKESADDLLKHADMAMYQVKEAGRNAVRFFDPAMQQMVETRAVLDADLRRAVPNQQLSLYYQIQVDENLRPLGAEALVRWIHPNRGIVSPAQFIPIAEESTLILDIGNWVLQTACQQLAVWAKEEQTRDLVLAVNVSAKQFRQHDFVDNISSELRKQGIKPSRLKLELTESLVLNDVSDVVTKMHSLKAIGVRLSLDDFGTGYSSLAYLKNLPLDQIKIDQSFVRDIASDPNDAVIVKTIIDMAHNFRLNVIAEGVETQTQLDFLKENGCLAYQGYLFSKPVPIDQFNALLKSS